MGCRRLQPGAIANVIRRGGQFQRRRPRLLDDRPLVVDRFLLLRMLLDVGLDVGAREAARQDPAARRHRLLLDERLVLVEKVPPAAVDPEVVRHHPVFGVAADTQPVVELDVVRIGLAPVDVLEVAAGGDQLVDESAVTRRVALERERHLDLLPARHPLLEIGNDVHQIRADLDHPAAAWSGDLLLSESRGSDGEKDEQESQLFHGARF
jgi:hypothetical protein